MRRRTIVTSLAAFFAVFPLAGSSQAGGLYVSTLGTPDMGTASAGANAIADGASVFHNPAGMTRIDDHRALMGLAPGFAVNEFDAASDPPPTGGDGGDQGGFVPISSSQYVHKLSERWRVGLALFSISGASLDPDNDWAGRNETTKVTLFTLTLMPAVAVRVTDWLSVGAGVGVSYGKLDMNLLVPVPLPVDTELPVKLKDMDDWEVTPFVGVLFEPTPEMRLGVLYQGETDFNLGGHIDLPVEAVGNVSIDLDFPLAQAVRASAFWEASERFDLLASAGWEDWSTLKNLPVSVPRGSGSVPTGFRDTWYVAGGVHYHLNDAWTLQTGVRYDSSALKDRDRTAILPIDRVWTLGVGGLYDWSENLRIGLSFVWADLGDAPLDTRFVKGKYRPNDLFLFGLSFDWKKLPWSGRATF